MTVAIAPRPMTVNTDTNGRTSPQGLVMIVGDDLSWGPGLDAICDFFGLVVEHVPSELDVAFLLREFRPMAVIAEADGRGQDGFHVMGAVAEYDRTLPMMLLTGHDAALMGAATQAAWQDGRPDVAMHNAMGYLRAFGHVVLAWLWLDVAVLAARQRQAGQGDATLLDGKQQAARYFFARELPQVSAWLAPVLEGDDQFATLDPAVL